MPKFSLQDKRVYKSESQLLIPYYGSFKYYNTVKEMNKYVKSVMNQKWYKRRFQHKMDVIIKDGRGYNYARTETGSNVIQIPKILRFDIIILHELAHCMFPSFNIEDDHGPVFCYVFLELVRYCIGNKFKKILHKLFIKNKVKCFAT